MDHLLSDAQLRGLQLDVRPTNAHRLAPPQAAVCDQVEERVKHVLPDKNNAAKDLGVFNIAGALPFSIAPAIAPAILAISSGSYSVLYAVAGVCAIIGAFAILPVKGVR